MKCSLSPPGVAMPVLKRRISSARLRMTVRTAAIGSALCLPWLGYPQSVRTGGAVSDAEVALLPDAPSDQLKGAPNGTKQAPDPQTVAEDEKLLQTKRVFGIIPNFRAVRSTSILPPQTAREKFLTATDDSFDYSSAFVPAAVAGYWMASRSYPEFGNGAKGYGRYFWHAALDQTTANYLVEFVVPVITHQDTRFYVLGHGGFWKRTGYAASRVLVTRTDTARPAFNYSTVGGSGLSALLSNAYYPSRERGVDITLQNWSVMLLVDGGANVLKEFWPDVYRRWFYHGDKRHR